jgi:NAD(P)-dependent dehydrogenase (short-subunit alcohol dehydrogenase family)
MWGGMPGMGHSGAARAGMVNFTQTAAVEWAAASQGSRIWPLPQARNNTPFNGFHRAVTPRVLSED